MVITVGMSSNLYSVVSAEACASPVPPPIQSPTLRARTDYSLTRESRKYLKETQSPTLRARTDEIPGYPIPVENAHARTHCIRKYYNSSRNAIAHVLIIHLHMNQKKNKFLPVANAAPCVPR